MLKSAKAKLVMFLSFVSMLGAQAQTENTNVTDSDLQKFADIFMEVQTENQNVQQEMVKVIKENGLEPQRFQEIQKAQMDPNTTAEVTDEETKSYEAVMSVLMEMQPKFEAKMQKIVTDNGLTLERYQKVATVIQTDTALQQKLQNIIVARQSGNENTEG
ncbi:protein of unknown function [Pustulibacterium marinum]|uniref:DUF4168 domain-containing protein n=1 Tax=Pustulibacterium marinum TaxID=1224947 RepID=A0A1I7FED4_9FLAO|nr:DUF4168 domain-containing protein [Pustulibacterium marinum]SFU34466.1 protein of unknown function [Pustulibacterium marinum]